MNASEISRRTIVRECKYIQLARAFQHDEAKLAVGGFIRSGSANTEILLAKAQELRARMADDDYYRTLYDLNADCISRFAEIALSTALPLAERLSPGQKPVAGINGLEIPIELHVRFQRINRVNKVKTGAAMLRYAKNKALDPEVGAMQSAFLFGYMRENESSDAGEPDAALCLTIDAHGGVAHAAPTDAIRRYNNMKALCSTIVEQWPNIRPPEGAILE